MKTKTKIVVLWVLLQKVGSFLTRLAGERYVLTTPFGSHEYHHYDWSRSFYL